LLVRFRARQRHVGLAAVQGTSPALVHAVDVALRPFFRRKYLLTIAEKRFYNVLRTVVAPHSVHPKVRLADLIETDKGHRFWRANFNRVCSKHIDFVVCDAALSPIIAVELDDSSHRLPERAVRDRKVNRILEIASLPILRVPVRRTYDAKAIEKDILAKLRPVG
jgi:hypothetical protein